jgi:glucose-1-phosphate adenylyltransferase
VRRSLLFSNVRVHSYCDIEDAVVLPDVEMHRKVRLRRCVIDRGCNLPAGLDVGLEPERDRERFFVTEQGVVLVTPDMLGQGMHHPP